jgi:hypothetical protein
MKSFLAIAALCMMVSAAVAGNGNKVAKATSNNANPVVYVYTKGNKAGVFYHTSGDCALKVRECISGEKAGIACTKELHAKEMGAMACPSCGHKHEKSVASK